MSALTLELASRIVDMALNRAGQLGLKPMTVAVLDAGGHLVAFKRQDSSGILGAVGASAVIPPITTKPVRSAASRRLGWAPILDDPLTTIRDLAMRPHCGAWHPFKVT
jgi:uncharacterized protein GlcG (DUF336 family)